ncbi:hypothetical protein IMG5_059930 [Ichthyophthirius multifiliis]|uniref:Phospholipase/carboxylesterase/thioesterase domain-containing protein n=1 Tax=Ichthyophthirius multifiliis TaxID=5932 RepID=G0QNL8_ICHMU|nr:hypothetical protein IMG5_059930 [Ichthyophthirius multifiliis]EGR33179.1 hypothetical protein IMG5_059930 [Ichthyophthirius multifiliis]|eukprot:XP_004037165.1 hypothetical protein IMG5_059930 [Ichthyophthirius multifiliis]
MMNKSTHNIEQQGENYYLIPKTSHTNTVIFLHGLGDCGQSYIDFFQESDIVSATTKVVLITAPVRPVTINFGMQLNSWFDFKNFDVNEQNFQQAIGIDEMIQSSQQLIQILNQEVNILQGQSQKVFIGGFSQGACMSLKVGLEFDQKLGGILAFSGFLFPVYNEHENNKNTPILISHGTQDPLLAWAKCEISYNKLKQSSHPLQFEIIQDLQHSFNMKSYTAFRNFFNKYK